MILLEIQTWQWDLEFGLPVLVAIVLAGIIWANTGGRR